MVSDQSEAFPARLWAPRTRRGPRSVLPEAIRGALLRCPAKLRHSLPSRLPRFLGLATTVPVEGTHLPIATHLPISSSNLISNSSQLISSSFSKQQMQKDSPRQPTISSCLPCRCGDASPRNKVPQVETCPEVENFQRGTSAAEIIVNHGAPERIQCSVGSFLVRFLRFLWSKHVIMRRTSCQ